VSPGVKFTDAELLGAPVVVVVGRGLAEGVVEVRLRREVGEGRPAGRQVPVADAAADVSRLVADLLAG
jgi:prolyl-tRNA synthetase